MLDSQSKVFSYDMNDVSALPELSHGGGGPVFIVTLPVLIKFFLGYFSLDLAFALLREIIWFTLFTSTVYSWSRPI